MVLTGQDGYLKSSAWGRKPIPDYPFTNEKAPAGNAEQTSCFKPEYFGALHLLTGEFSTCSSPE
ncbi:MAG: hypothetical protein OXF56_03030 [Rhodobacteraceae bacterium]|nr:hypothetical protein [Paracoccaceae bacterium]